MSANTAHKDEARSNSQWHTVSGDDALASLTATAMGLTSEGVSERLARYGPNILPEPPTKSLIAVYISQFKNAFITLLLIAAAVSIALGEWGDALFIILALQINAVIGTYQEWKAQSKALALRLMVKTTAMVLRDGDWLNIPSRDLVPGDIIRVEAGMRVPAQHRLLETHSLEVDESLLTGESLPVAKSCDETLPIHTPLGDQINMLHSGTVILRGSGLALTTATGLKTVVGQVAASLKMVEDIPPPLMRKMKKFTRVVALWMVGLIALIALAEALRDVPTEQIFMTAVALAVAAIPEGLPVALTVTLAISVTRMSKRNVVVRKLAAVEGLGACTLIAADKTGTLTQNRLSVEKTYLPNIGEVDRNNFEGEHAADLRDIAITGALCNEARLHNNTDGTFNIIGDTVDGALLIMADRLGIDRDAENIRTPEVHQLPYASEAAFAASFRQTDVEGESLAHVKGAPEIIFPMCHMDG
ncbi:MAG: HAD-IC family P-type ATPase, partial [Sphingomonadales bacterium]|nr:HAD-IC family P-type ATPase [Sphingomonadales bacterium]